MYLTKEDYTVTADNYTVEVLSQSSETNRQRAERVAMEEVSSYLRSRYDIASAYRQTGDDRNAKLVQITVDIAAYYMAHALAQNMGFDAREDLYTHAINWLKDVQKGNASPDLPLYTNADGDDTGNPVRYGGMKANKYDY